MGVVLKRKVAKMDLETMLAVGFFVMLIAQMVVRRANGMLYALFVCITTILACGGLCVVLLKFGMNVLTVWLLLRVCFWAAVAMIGMVVLCRMIMTAYRESEEIFDFTP